MPLPDPRLIGDSFDAWEPTERDWHVPRKFGGKRNILAHQRTSGAATMRAVPFAAGVDSTRAAMARIRSRSRARPRRAALERRTPAPPHPRSR